MREILFRGKRTDNGEWITDSETYIRDGDGIWLSDENLNVVTVIPETVGQYTGLTDKNGVRIFEGDILKSTIKIIDCSDEGFSVSYDEEDIGIVEWRKGEFLMAHKTGNWARSFYGCENYVIGNIHDNPDMLRGGGDNG